ncbi:MAG TPA: endonuclease domain-containing protein [Sphingopyxis sp.]|nr:endonuclease domain-containing protein [Sphingopyxis sp.]HMP45882.1 endonuclease domain-containing protein [Sphingopyxis sp.]HMQ20733.1 endonuclease domain-containing protein [Sphingopyxis sp.]
MKAQRLRREPTPAERTLWRAISKRQLEGWKFSRQMPIGPYVADFLCREERLVIELDGMSHDIRQEEDRRREGYLKKQGYQTLRFSNADVLSNLEGVLMTIVAALNSGPPPAPPACGRGEA